jgi:hypothetical protein
MADAKDETQQIDTSKVIRPNEELDQSTPIGDEALAAAREYLKGVDDAEITHFDEDDDPLSLVGDVVEDD